MSNLDGFLLSLMFAIATRADGPFDAVCPEIMQIRQASRVAASISKNPSLMSGLRAGLN